MVLPKSFQKKKQKKTAESNFFLTFMIWCRDSMTTPADSEVSPDKFIQLAAGRPLLRLEAVGVDIHGSGAAGMSQVF